MILYLLNNRIDIYTRVVKLGTTTKLCYSIFVPQPHPGHVVVVFKRKLDKERLVSLSFSFYFTTKNEQL